MFDERSRNVVLFWRKEKATEIMAKALAFASA
jgi:hypothetical protein